MIRILIISLIILTISCSKNQSNNNFSDSTERLTSADTSELKNKKETNQIKLEIAKVSISYDQLINSKWINRIIDGVYDSLIFTTSENVKHYSAEMDYLRNSKYRIDNDTLKIDIYDLKSQVDPNAGLEIVSKYHLILSDSSLRFTKILHRYRDKFIEVDKGIYDNVNEFILAK